MGLGSRNTLGSSVQMSHRSRPRHEDDVVDDEDDEFQDVSDASRGGPYGPSDAVGGFEEDDEDLDLLERHSSHHYQQRRRSGGRNVGSLDGTGDSGSGKMPPVKFISRSGTSGARSSYFSRKDLL